MTSVRALVTTSVAGLLAACALVAAAPLAEARSLTDAEAENAARMAVAPEPVVDVLCFRASTRRGKPEKRRALCLVGRPGPEGLVCDSVVEVTVPRARYGAISTDVVRLNVCMPPHDRSKNCSKPILPANVAPMWRIPPRGGSVTMTMTRAPDLRGPGHLRGSTGD